MHQIFFLKQQCMTEVHISFKLFRIKGFFRQGIYFDASRIRISILMKSDIFHHLNPRDDNQWKKRCLTKLTKMGLNLVIQNVKSCIWI